MITILSKIFISQSMPKERIRSAYGVLCGVVGIFLNLLLFGGKFFAGWLSGSIAITADAFNNLSDAGSSVVTLVGFKLAAQKPDSHHPFGHGRMEYIAGLVVAAVIFFMGIELMRDSITKILYPKDTQFSGLILCILLISIIVKCYMAFYNNHIGKKIGSSTIKAVAMDSLSDCVATLVVLICTLLCHYAHLQIDGYCGVLVSLFIFYAGFSAGRDTLNPLLGQPPEKEFVEKIEHIVLHFDENICGVHDLIVHDYGPGRRIISLHAEVPADGNLLQLHDIIDNLEMTLAKEMGCVATIHMDPVVTHDAHIGHLKQQVMDIVHDIDTIISLHDFRVVKGDSHTNIIFDIVIPYRYRMTDEAVKTAIQKKVNTEIGEEYFTVIQIDKVTFSS